MAREWTPPGPLPDGTEPPAQEAASEPDPKPELRVIPVSQIKIKATEWLWHHRIPLGALTLLPGREGTGKSTAGAWLTAQVTRGTLPGVYEGVPRGVFYAAREDDWERTIAPRIVAAGADTSRVYRIEVVVCDGLIELVLPQHVELLRDNIRKYEVGLLFLDPLMSVISGAIDTHKDREARMALEPLATLAMETDSSVVGLAHFSKAMTTDALNLVMASKAFTAVPRAVIGMARDDDAEEDNVVVLSQIKSNLGPLEVPSLKFTFQQVTVETEDGRGAHVGKLVELGESDRSVTEILAGRGDEADQDSWNEATWWLYEYVIGAGGEAAARDIFAAGKADGHSKDSLKRASQKLALAKRKDGFQGRWLWVFDATHSKQPEGPNPKGAKGANQSETQNPLRPMRPLASTPKRQSRKVAKKGADVVPIRKPPDDAETGEDPAS
jgi:AAA domain